MAERLYRLITFIVDICTPVLKQLLIKCAKEDTKITYTTLKVYMLSRKPDIIKLKAVSQEKFQNVYPSPGLFVEGSLDVTLLATLLLNLFGTTLQPVETQSIKTIRDIRNLFLHKSCTDSVDENEFDAKWSDLKTNVLIIARFVGGADYEDNTISKIQDTMTNNLPNLDNSLRNWYQSVNTELRLRLTSMETTLNSTTAELSSVKTELSLVKAELTSIKIGIQSVEQQSKETKAASSKVGTIVSNMSTKRINREGLECDRILVADPVADRIKENFHKMVREHKTDDISFQNLEDIKNILQKQHRVVITGGHDTPYLPVAIKVVENMGYDIRQCVEITDKDEWNIVRPADTKLVLCKYPFGRFTLDEQKARSMFTAFDSMLHCTRDSEETRMAFIIVSELEIVDAAIKIISQGTGHEFLEARIDMDVEDSYVQEASTADDTEFHLRLEATRAFRATRSPFAIPFATTIVEKAREMLRQDKYIILTGQMGCGKTCVALELASLYHPDRCLKLNRPEDIKLVSSRRTSLVLVEDFAGRNQYDEFRMQEWIEAFETLVQREHEERVDVVATCASECLEQFRNEIVRQHDHVLEVPYLTVVIHDKACGEQVKGQLSELTGQPSSKGPKKKIDDIHKQFIDMWMEQDQELSSADIKKRLERYFGIIVTQQHVSKIRRELGWRMNAVKYCQLISNVNKEKRLVWCLKAMETRDRFENVIFVDETSVEMSGAGRLVFHKKTTNIERLPAKSSKPKHPYKVHVWGGISYRGRTSVCIFTGIMDSVTYQQILRDNLLGFASSTFPDGFRLYQDNDSKHKSRSTKQWMEEVGLLEKVMETPASSPDINPIENVWSSMKFFLQRHVKPTTKAQLIEGIRNFWEGLDVKQCGKYIDHVHRVVEHVILNKGNPTEF